MSSRFTPPFSTTQQKVLAILPKVTSVPSIVGSAFLVQLVLRRRSSTGQVYHRLMLSMSLMDFIFSIKSFVSTWPMPEETLFVWGARGSVESCTAFGFIGHGSGLSSALYNFSLTLYFLLSISFSWNERRIRERVELLLHAIPLTIGWGTAIAGIPLDLYNPLGWTCWIGAFPPGCGQDTFPCTRSNPDDADMYRWVFFHAELWFLYLMSVVSMVAIYMSVRRRETAMNKYHFSGSSSSSTSLEKHSPSRVSLSRRVAVQASLYMFFFFITWIFPMVQFVVSQRTGKLFFPFLTLTVILQPLQGFFDCCIYLRPRYLKHVKNREGSRDQARRSAAILAALSAKEDDVDVDGEVFDPDADENTSSPHSAQPEKPNETARPERLAEVETVERH